MYRGGEESGSCWWSCDSTICQQHNSQFASFTSRFRSFGHCAVKRQTQLRQELHPPLSLSLSCSHWEYVTMCMGIALATTRPHHQVTIVQTVLFYGIKGHPFVLNGRGGHWTRRQAGGRGQGTSVERRAYALRHFVFSSFVLLPPSIRRLSHKLFMIHHCAIFGKSLQTLYGPLRLPLSVSHACRYSCPLTRAISFKLNPSSLPAHARDTCVTRSDTRRFISLIASEWNK